MMPTMKKTLLFAVGIGHHGCDAIKIRKMGANGFLAETAKTVQELAYGTALALAASCLLDEAAREVDPEFYNQTSTCEKLELGGCVTAILCGATCSKACKCPRGCSEPEIIEVPPITAVEEIFDVKPKTPTPGQPMPLLAKIPSDTQPGTTSAEEIVSV